MWDCMASASLSSRSSAARAAAARARHHASSRTGSPGTAAGAGVTAVTAGAPGGATASAGDALTGHSYKLPFHAEQKAYPFWDDQLGEAVDIEFVAVEEISGLEAYKYEHTIPATRIAYDPDTLALLRSVSAKTGMHPTWSTGVADAQ